MSEELIKYFKRADSLLDDADLLMRNGKYNSAVNRAYYAIFAAIQAALTHHGIIAKSHTGSHSKFRELYIKQNLLPIELNEFLTIVFDMRQEADYNFDESPDEIGASEAVDMAEKFCAHIKSYFEKNK